MLSLFKLWTVSVFEIKTLARSWFFRIFAAISIILILFIDYLFFSNTGIGSMMWSIRSIPSSIPYLNTFLVNMAQAIIAIFIASEFLKQDRKLNSTETIYSRSMSNAEYVFGKTIGVFILFMGLNFVVLAGAMIVNVFFSTVPVRYTLYLVYPLLISIPTILFILGLSFFVMSTVQNQAVTFIILLAYIAGTLFYFGNHFHYLLDYMAYNLPLLYSDIVGFGDITQILIHRGMYLLMGIGFICTTALMLQRLPQSPFMNKIVRVVMVVSFVAVGFLGYRYIAEI